MERSFLIGMALLVSSCGPLQSPEQQIVDTFANATINGDLNTAVLFMSGPAAQNRERLESLRRDTEGCQLSDVEIRPVPRGTVASKKAVISLIGNCPLDKFEVGLTGSGRQVRVIQTHWTRFHKRLLV